MNIPSEQRPDYVPEPGQYRVEDLQPILTHEELIDLDCIDTIEAAKALTCFVGLGRVALSEGDHQAYDAWMAHTTSFVDRLQDDPDLSRPEEYEKFITRLQFHGVAQGRHDMEDKLHDALSQTADRRAIVEIVELCAQYQVNPSTWIEQHVPDPDDKAGVWNKFFEQKQAEAREAGRELTPEEWREPGSECVFQDILAGKIPDEGVLNWGTMAYRGAATVQDKLRLIEYYSATMLRWTKATPEIPFYDKRAMYSFATEVMSDPEIPQTTKLDLYDKTMSWEVSFSQLDAFMRRGELEIAKAVQTGEDVHAVFEKLCDIADTFEESRRNFEDYREFFTIVAAAQYAKQGNFGQAAQYVSVLDEIPIWWNSLEHYLQKGGNLDEVRKVNEVRHEVYEEMGVDEAVEGSRYEMQQAICNFYDYTEQNPDREKAQELLLQVAERTRHGSGLEAQIRGEVLRRFVRSMLAKDSATVAIGPMLVASLERDVDALPFYELFARYGSQEMAAAGWQYVQTHPETTPRRCLSKHASMLLASHMLKPEPEVTFLSFIV